MSGNYEEELITERELKERALELAKASREQESQPDLPLLLFSRGGNYFGLPASAVSEVLSAPEIYPLPLAPDFAPGLVNLRGELIGAVEAAALFGLKDAGPASEAVILRSGGRVLALLAGKTEGVSYFDSLTLEPVLSTLPPEAARFFDGAVNSGGRPAAVINTEMIFEYPRLKEYCGE